jgi:hypothetical protein
VVARSHLVPLRLMNPHPLLLCSVAVLLQASPALAWGDIGHRIICEIAFRELNDTARERVKVMIRRDPEFDTFAEACSWPDRPRRRASEHYVNLPRDAPGFDEELCPLADECVVSAIEKDQCYRPRAPPSRSSSMP